jgi:hypothetical protein
MARPGQVLMMGSSEDDVKEGQKFEAEKAALATELGRPRRTGRYLSGRVGDERNEDVVGNRLSGSRKFLHGAMLQLARLNKTKGPLDSTPTLPFHLI